jgi:hypothetical protein
MIKRSDLLAGRTSRQALGKALLAQQEGHRQWHQQRCDQRIRTHCNASEYARDLVDLKGARDADAVRRENGSRLMARSLGASTNGWREMSRP